MYDADPDPYCYPDTAVLINLLDLRDLDALTAFESDAVTQRSDEPLPDGELDVDHLRAIHHHLFQDIYARAGDFRTVRIAKDRSMFCYPENIQPELERLLESLAAADFLRTVSAEEFATQGARFLSELNAIHPFRDGNGRAQMVFFGLVADRAEYPLDIGLLDPDNFLAAMIAAFHGSEAALATEIRQMI